MNYISLDILKKYNCCNSQVKLFKELFPSGIVEFNSLREAELLAKKYSNKFDFSYLGCEVFGGTYIEAIRPHLDVYEKAIEPHWDAYEKAKKPYWDAYEKAKKPYWDAYLEATKPHLDAYKEAEKPLWDAYEEAKKPHLEAYKKVEKPLYDTYELAQSQVFAKLWYELKG